jgi:hypothetical protein
VVSQTATGAPWTNDNRRSSISADGRFVEFDTRLQTNQVSLRDRVQNTTVNTPSVPSLDGSISDDGCVIAYTLGTPTNIGSGSFYTILAFDRCAGLNLAVGSAFVTPGGLTPRPIPNQDGSVIVWTTPTTIEHSTRSGNTYAQAAPITIGKFAFTPQVSVSDNGNLIAVQTTSGLVGVVDRTAPTNLEPVSVDQNGAPIPNSAEPSISGDGRLVTFSVRFLDNVSAVFVRDRADGETRGIAVRARAAAISRDGNYVSYTDQVGEVGDVRVARSTSSVPFASLVTDLLSYVDGDPTQTTNGASTNSAISEHGRWVSFDSYAANLLVPNQGFDRGNHVFVRQRRPIVTVDSIDFGVVGGPTDRQATIRSVGLAGFVITSIDATGDFSVVGDNCPAVLQPDASCVVTVRFGAATNGQKTGTLSVRDDSYPTVPLVGLGRLEGIVDLQIPPPPTLPPPARAGLDITPDPVVFDNVVVGSPAAQRAATVTNTGDVSITVAGISLSGPAAGDFSVGTDGCTDVTLVSGASCELTLGFTASQAGGRSATVTATGSGSVTASAALSGSGRFDAELMVTPEVAAGGQVVTVVGSGFPPSTSVDIVLGNDPAVPVTTDAGGGFMLSWLILSGTPQGELLADDVAVVGAYDAEPAPLQVVGTPMRPQATAALSRSGRSLVSR